MQKLGIHWHLCASCCCHVCCRSSVSRLLVCGKNDWVCIIFMEETLKLNVMWQTIWELNRDVCRNYTLV